MAAYCLDGAVVAFGTIVENALMEVVEVGSGEHKGRRPRYTLSQILAPAFCLPRLEAERAGDLESLHGVAGGFFDEVS